MTRSYRSSTRGRYHSNDCPICYGDEPRSSKLESDVFTLIEFVLGTGERGVAVPTDRRMVLDMRFRGRGGLPIGIEYDGAYWHAAKEDADLRKTHRLLSSGTAAVVVRIREAPLHPLSYEDVRVATGAPPAVIAIATLLHLIHIEAVDTGVEARVAAALSATGVSLHQHRIYCRKCRWKLAELLDLGAAYVTNNRRTRLRATVARR